MGYLVVGVERAITSRYASAGGFVKRNVKI
jgi:hypothetical protein